MDYSNSTLQRSSEVEFVCSVCETVSVGGGNNTYTPPRHQSHLTCDVHAVLRTFLEMASSEYELVLFTASLQPYADAILEVLDPQGSIFKHRLYRESCSQPSQLNGAYAKDLRVLG